MIDDKVTDLYFSDGKILTFIRGRTEHKWRDLKDDYKGIDKIVMPILQWFPILGGSAAAVLFELAKAPDRYVHVACAAAVTALFAVSFRNRRSQYNPFHLKFPGGKPRMPDPNEEKRALFDLYSQYVHIPIAYDPLHKLNQS